MERFIGFAFSDENVIFSIFKIQYGEIYSLVIFIHYAQNNYLKSSMERFIDHKLCV